MNTNLLSRVAALGLAGLICAASVQAAELSYSSTPLFWSTGVQPNVAFLVDNSGSMSTSDTGNDGTGNITSACDGISSWAQPLSRMRAAQHAACKVIQDNATSMRISLFAFTGGGATDTTSTGIQRVVFGSTATTLKTSVSGLSANQNTPLSGAMQTILNSYRGGVSPIQYRCQKNYVVFFTDGEPSSGIDYDVNQNGPVGTTCATNASSCNTFVLPFLTPVQYSSWVNSAAPIIDPPFSTAASNGVTGSTTADSWDGFSDPVYSGGGGRLVYPFLDDLAQFGYDVDFKTNSNVAVPVATCPPGSVSAAGKDCAGKSWDGDDDTDKRFAQQNVVTYTIGLGAEANNGLLRNTPLVNRINLSPADVNVGTDEITMIGHGLKDGQFVHYVNSYLPTATLSTKGPASTLSDNVAVPAVEIQYMKDADLLSYSNAGGASLEYLVTPAVPGGLCTDVGATMGLTSGATYYAANRGGSVLRLAKDPAAAALCAAAGDNTVAVGTNCIDLATAGAYSTTQTLTRPGVASFSANFTMVSPYPNVDPVNETITIAHSFSTQDQIEYNCVNPATSGICPAGGARVIGGLTPGSFYYVAVVSPTVFKLASTAARAATCAAGTLADCLNIAKPTSTGTAASDVRRHYFFRAAVPALVNSFVVPTLPVLPALPLTPVNPATNYEKLTFGANHNLTTGNAVVYTCSGGITPVPAVTASAGSYYAKNVSTGTGTFQLSLTAGGAPVNIYIAGNANQTFSWTRTNFKEQTIAGLYPYETDARPDNTPTPGPLLTGEASARGKYYVERVDADHFQLRQCGNTTDCTTEGAVVDLTSTGYGALSTGPGESYFSDTAAELSVALATAFSAISANTLSFSAVATTSEQYGASMIYQARFATADWSGEIIAYPILASGAPDTANPVWTASDFLNVPPEPPLFIARGPVFTWDNIANVGELVTNVGNLTPTQQLSFGPVIADRQRVLDWVLGKDDLTLLGSRVRLNSLYGDILGGSPHFVGGPNGDYDQTLEPGKPGKSTYAAFKTAKAGRTPMLYVGSNDGMLHGLDANTGYVKMSYLPYGVYTDWVDANDDGILNGAELPIQKFYELSRDNYGQIPALPHRYFVDGAPNSGDAFFTSSKVGIAANSWHTVLVGGLGKGGRSIYALDVTNPASLDENNVLWDFSTPANGKMGYSYSEPVITRLQTGQWAVIFGNGYDAAGDVGSLYILDIETGAVIKRIDAIGSKGMSNISVLKDNYGTAAIVYGGDLAGNVWRFNISSNSSASWPTTVNTPFFIARDTSGNRQPITSSITLGPVSPSGGCAAGDYCTMLYFGTGSYFQTSDQSYNPATASPINDTFYALMDNDTGNIPNKSTLVQQTIGTTTVNSIVYRTSTKNPVDYTTNDGWYMDMTVGGVREGERIVFEPVLVYGTLFFTTIVPASADPCIAGSTSWLMGLNALDGNMRDVMFDTNGDGKFDDTDVPTSGIQSTNGLFTLPVVRLVEVLVYGTDGTVTTQTVAQLYVGTSGGTNKPPTIENIIALLGSKSVVPPGAYPSGRMSWRQLQ